MVAQPEKLIEVVIYVVFPGKFYIHTGLLVDLLSLAVREFYYRCNGVRRLWLTVIDRSIFTGADRAPRVTGACRSPPVTRPQGRLRFRRHCDSHTGGPRAEVALSALYPRYRPANFAGKDVVVSGSG